MGAYETRPQYEAQLLTIKLYTNMKHLLLVFIINKNNEKN